MSVRPRRLRASAALRAMVAETVVRPEHLVWPTFVVDGHDRVEPIASLPRVARRSVDRLLPELERALSLGVRSVMLFGVVDDAVKDPLGTAALDPAGPVPAALRAARSAFGDDLVLMTDVCLCGYTDHGHCGVLAAPRPGGTLARVVDGPTLPRLAAMAVAHAEAGADVVAPSDMMDGRVAALRQGLDAGGHGDVAILAYAVKYASAFYGPFRDAAGSSPHGGIDGHPAPTDRRSYQMDPRNGREADLEAALDEAEGADLLMVKPALPYLDVVARVRSSSDRPLAAYMVSGEYAMLEAAAAAGALDRAAAVREALVAIRRAGADLVLTYHALEAAAGGWTT
jgi:porphobilinogen synthase